MRSMTSEGSAKAAEPELSYFATGDERRTAAGIGFVVALPLMAYAGVQVITGSIGLGLLAGAVTVAWPVIARRRAKNRPRATLRVDSGRLYLSGPAFNEARTVELPDLFDVYLDTTTIQRVRDGSSPVPAVRVLNQTVDAAQDVSRIALELQSETLFLTEQRVSHLEANESFSKIRRFLRRNGWVPLDERPKPNTGPSAD